MRKLKACSRCGGLMYLDKEPDGIEWACFNCGCRVYENHIPEEVQVDGRRSPRPRGYWEERKDEMTADYESMKLVDFYSKWRLCSTVWMRLRTSWDIPMRRPNYSRRHRAQQAEVLKEASV